MRKAEAFDRLAWIGRLGSPGSIVYGAAVHLYDHDFPPILRRWVMRAVYRSSRFAQVRGFMRLVLPCRAADPSWVALRGKGWECYSLVRRLWGGPAFEKVWSRASRGGPLLSFKRLLQEQGLEASSLAAGPEWLRKHSAHKM